MQYKQSEFKTYPPRVVGSITYLEDWEALPGSDVADECDWIEMRLDTFPHYFAIDELMKNRPYLPILATARCMEEGGKREFDEKDRLKLLHDFIPYAHAIDIEIACMDHATQLIEDARHNGTFIVASAHDFEKTPDVSYLKELDRAARDKGADIVKLAFMITCPEDIAKGIQVIQEATGPIAVMGMGPLGPTSRLYFSQIGSCLLYGYLGSYPSAPGQWSAKAFKQALQALSPLETNSCLQLKDQERRLSE